MKSQLLLCGRLGVLLLISCAAFAAGPGPRRTTRKVLLDKIRGGWAGQMIGVSYGAPTEFRAMGKINDEPLSWAPDRVENAIHQDDLYVEMASSPPDAVARHRKEAPPRISGFVEWAGVDTCKPRPE